MASPASINDTRSSLVSRARKREPSAWRDLVALYGPLIVYWCRRCGLDEHASADCMQEVLAAVAISLDRFQPKNSSGSFRGWLWTITQNKLRDQMRKNFRQPIASGGSSARTAIEQLPDARTIPDNEPSDMTSLSQLTHRALTQVEGEFEPQTWKVFWRSVIDNIPTEHVATEFGLSAAAVRQVRSRVLRRLRLQLGDIEQ